MHFGLGPLTQEDFIYTSSNSSTLQLNHQRRLEISNVGRKSESAVSLDVRCVCAETGSGEHGGADPDEDEL